MADKRSRANIRIPEDVPFINRATAMVLKKGKKNWCERNFPLNSGVRAILEKGRPTLRVKGRRARSSFRRSNGSSTCGESGRFLPDDKS